MSSSASSNPPSSSSATPLSERRLADLTDAEIASLTAELKDSEARKDPLVGTQEPLQLLRDEYDHEGASMFVRKIDALSAGGWRTIRRMRRDGDCFYRAFIFAYVERLVDAPPAEAQAALATFSSLCEMIYALGYEKDITQDFYEPLESLLQSLANPSARPSHTSVHSTFNDPDLGQSQSIIVFLRILTSAYLKSHPDDFVPFLFSLEDDPRFFQAGVPTLDQFCGFHVEAVGKEADNIQITALTRALGVHVQIAYLDQSGVARDGSDVNFHEFETESGLKLGKALLYRPGHYDILER